MLHKVQAALAAIQTSGTFATELISSSEDLEIEIKGVGPLRFPISSAAARKLCTVASPAPFGRRDKTLHDTSVRDSWQLDRRQVKIDARRWKRSLDAALSSIKRRLGLPDDGQLEAVFDKMLVYGAGQFFAPHQDSERADDMIGSLVVELPSAYSGGAFVVEHNQEKKVFRRRKRGPKDLVLCAFYADCRHEVRPVETGNRIALTYQLRYQDVTGTAVPARLSAAMDLLSASVKAYFSTPVAAAYGRTAPQKPDRLIYLLDHEYTQKSLAWDRLKNGDRLRAAALRQVAEELDCELYLALADVHENWSCEGDEWDAGYGRGRRSGWYLSYENDPEEDEDDKAPEDYKLEELCDWDVELRNWVGSDGKAAPGIPTSPAESEVCYTRASVDMAPFKAEHEGWMGNYGNTVDRWYHRAAVVMWPRERTFVIRAKQSPDWAVSELAAQIKAGAVNEAREQARRLLPFWNHTALRETRATFFLKLLKVLASLEDAELAHALLAPFGPHRLSLRDIPAFLALVTRHGLLWSKQVFTIWFERQRYDTPPWLNILPRFCAELLATRAEFGRALAMWLLEREVAAFEQRQKDALKLPTARLLEDKANHLQDDLLALLEGAAVLEATSIRDRLLAFLMAPATALPLTSAGELLKKCQAGRTPAAVRALGLHVLYRHAVDTLEQTLAAPKRSPDDWSIEAPLQCTCELCAELSAFLRDPHGIEHAWPLAQDRRRHIHNMIDAHDLPVTHKTTRQGRPYTLVLTKQKALFQRAAALRKRQQGLLSWLKQQRATFEIDQVGPKGRGDALGHEHERISIL